MKRACLLLLTACAGEPASEVVIAPDWDGARVEVPGAVLGHNTVWSRGGLGLWDEDAGEIDAAAWPHVEPLAPGALRFPGGTRGLRWHFAGTLGPAASRVAQCDTFRGELDATGYGLGEMLEVAARAGAPLTLVTPLSDGTPEEAAAMLAYVAGDPADATALGVDRAGVDWQTAGAWAARRAAPAPEVLLVEIGNEPYLSLPVGPSSSCGRPGRFLQDERWEGDTAIPITAADYAAQVRLHADALRAVDPDVVVGAAAMTELGAAPGVAAVIAEHDSAAGDPWNPRLLADAGDAFDAWVVHPYDVSAVDDRVELAERARVITRELTALDPSKRIAVTEFGTLLDADTMLGALLTADFVRVAIEEQWLVLMRHILIEDDPTGPFAGSAAILGPDHQRTPGWHAAHLLATHLQPSAVAVVVEGGEPEVVALATRSADTLGVIIIDRRVRADAPPRSVELALPAGAWSGIATQVSAPALTSRDVTRTETPVAGTATIVIEAPPASLTTLRLSR